MLPVLPGDVLHHHADPPHRLGLELLDELAGPPGAGG